MADPKNPHFLSSKTIIISGAGIAGLTLAVALSEHFPSKDVQACRPRIVIYERDSHEERLGREGYSLSLRTDNEPGGVQVLDFLGLYERVRSVSVNADDAEADQGHFNLWDPNFVPILRFRGRPFGPKKLLAMRIRRNVLQRELADAATNAGAEIHWSTAVVDARPIPSDDDDSSTTKVQIALSNGETVRGDILIAADGSRSKLRSLLRPADTLDYTGVYTWGGTARFPDRTAIPKPVDRDWGVVLGGGGIGLFVSPNDDKSALWGLSRASKEPQPPLHYPIPQSRLTELLDESTRLSSSFAPVVRDLVAATDPSTVMLFNAMDRPPFPHLPLTNGPVVWIGDANHAVSPFAGNGANMALMDAWDLAKCLKNATSLEEALKAYDAVAVPRAQAVLRMSHWSIDLAHASGLKLWVYKVFLKIMSYFGPVPV